VARRNRQGTEMFTCANCGIARPDTERGSAGIVANIGFIVTLRSPWWPSAVCRHCVRQVRMFGLACLALVVALALTLIVTRWWP
jgi:hypothetical protein